MWNERFSAPEYAYGKQPNSFLQQCIERYQPKGSMLFPAEGEGRNAVYAAKKTLEVTAFDISEEGKKKALQLAQEEGVQIKYHVGEYLSLPIASQHFDHAALIYAHFPPQIRSAYNKNIVQSIRSGGFIFFEGFSKNHLQYRTENLDVGGPSSSELLFSTDELVEDFAGCSIEYLQEEVIELNEGLYHRGRGSVVRFIGIKQ